jgi:hypothetical protein
MTRTQYVIRFAIVSLFCLTTAACEPDPAALVSVDTTAAAITGTVRDLGGQPVASARVEVGDETVLTGEDGTFELGNVPQDTIVQVFARAPGFSTGHLTVEVAGPTVRRVDIRVIPAVETTIQASDGGRIVRPDGVVIDLPAGAYVDAAGQPVDGEITVSTAAWRSELSMLAAQGAMQAVVDGEQFPLESFGMVQVELSSDGEPVELDGTARLELPLAHSARFVEGEKVGLWHFDEDSGVWSLDGEGEVFGHTFVAEVTHFSTWNCDRPLETSCLGGTLQAPNGEPISGGQVHALGIDYFGSDTQWTAEDGSFELLGRTSSKVTVGSSGALLGSEEGLFGFELEATLPDTLAGSGPCLDLGTIIVADLSSDDDGDGFSELQGDCDDDDITRFPEAEELCNWIDEDCNSVVEQGPDLDFDGEGDCLDCDDDEWSVHTRAPDVCDEVLDNNCDGETDARESDVDADGMTFCAGDCDDSDPNLTDGCSWRALSAGQDFTCGIRPMGDIACWGSLRPEVGSVPAGVYIEVSSGDGFACGLLESGGVNCWSNAATWTPPALEQARSSLASGATHRCGLDFDGIALCEGGNDFSQSTSPGGNYVELTAGALHTCGLSAESEVTCWGSNAAGQALPPEAAFETLTAGSIHTCGVDPEGRAVCWGDDGFGQLTAPADLVMTELTAGAHHTCGLTARGTVACWGSNEWGQSTPPAGILRQVTAGAAHTCAIDARGQARCWGDNSSGQSTVPD